MSISGINMPKKEGTDERTRKREHRKNPNVYSQKHVRLLEALRERRSESSHLNPKQTKWIMLWRRTRWLHVLIRNIVAPFAWIQWVPKMYENTTRKWHVVMCSTQIVLTNGRGEERPVHVAEPRCLNGPMLTTCHCLTAVYSCWWQTRDPCGTIVTCLWTLESLSLRSPRRFSTRRYRFTIMQHVDCSFYTRQFNRVSCNSFFGFFILFY